MPVLDQNGTFIAMAVSFFRGALLALLFLEAQCAPTTLEATTVDETTVSAFTTPAETTFESTTAEATTGFSTTGISSTGFSTEASTSVASTSEASTSEAPSTPSFLSSSIGVLPECGLTIEELKFEIIKAGGVLFRLLVDKQMMFGDIWRRVTTSFEEYLQYLATDSYMEDYVAFIITEEMYSTFQVQCPELVKQTIYKKSGPRDSTCVGSEPPADDWEEDGAFYCAPAEGVCGANFPIYQVQEYEDDYWILSDQNEITNSVNYTNQSILCYAWKDENYQTTILEYYKEIQQTIVTSTSSSKVYHLVFGDTYEERYSRYTTDITVVIELMRQGFKLEPSLSFIVTEELQAQIATECPYLVPMNIYTSDSAEGSKQLNLIDTKVYEEYGNYSVSETFYCAPYAGYCGATKPMYYLKLTGGSITDNMYTESYDQILNYIQQPEYATSTDRLVCYGWDDSTAYDRTVVDKVINSATVLYRGFVDKQMPVDWWRRYAFYDKFVSSISTEAYLEEYVGMVITEDQYQFIKEDCPNLKKMKIYQKSGDRTPSCIRDEAPSSDWEMQGSFYCSPEPDYCGANFELMEIPESPEDFFYPSESTEISGYQDQGITPTSLCYIWKPINISAPRSQYTTAQTSIISTSSKLYTLTMTTETSTYHVYTFDVTVKESYVSQGYVEEKYVSIGCDAATKSALEDDCPELIPLNIYQKPSDPPITLIDMKVYESQGDYELKETFYYAPFAGYCGASRPIYAVYSSTPGVDNFYTANFSQIVEIYYAEGPFQYQPSKIIGYGWDEGDQHDIRSGSHSGAPPSTSGSSED